MAVYDFLLQSTICPSNGCWTWSHEYSNSALVSFLFFFIVTSWILISPAITLNLSIQYNMSNESGTSKDHPSAKAPQKTVVRAAYRSEDGEQFSWPIRWPSWIFQLNLGNLPPKPKANELRQNANVSGPSFPLFIIVRLLTHQLILNSNTHEHHPGLIQVSYNAVAIHVCMLIHICRPAPLACLCVL